MDELAARVEALQRQVGELAERQDFTERLLAKVRRRACRQEEEHHDARSLASGHGPDRRPDLRDDHGHRDHPAFWSSGPSAGRSVG